MLQDVFEHIFQHDNRNLAIDFNTVNIYLCYTQGSAIFCAKTICEIEPVSTNFESNLSQVERQVVKFQQLKCEPYLII